MSRRSGDTLTATADSFGGGGASGIDLLPDFRVGDPIVGPMLALRRDPLTALIEPYRRFGRIFRMRLLGRPTIVIAGLDANTFAWSDAGDWLDGTLPPEKRRRLAPAFRPRALQRQVAVMAEPWFEAIAASRDQVVDLRTMCKRLVVQMTGRALLRIELPPGADVDISRPEPDLLAGTALGPLRREWFRRPSHRARKQDFERVVSELVAERRADWSGDDLLSTILREWPHGGRLPTTAELTADVVLLLQAGSDSTAHQILWTLLLLQSRPEWLGELRAELDGWSPDASADLGGLPLLRATVLESERLRPAIPFARRVAARDLSFSSTRIPAGAAVLHATTLTHFFDEIYEDPFAFRPERFLDGRDRPGAAHGTFGGGSRVCPGQPLARIQVPLGVAIMAKHAALTQCAPISLRAKLDGVVTPVERALPTRVTQRLP